MLLSLQKIHSQTAYRHCDLFPIQVIMMVHTRWVLYLLMRKEDTLKIKVIFHFGYDLRYVFMITKCFFFHSSLIFCARVIIATLFCSMFGHQPFIKDKIKLTQYGRQWNTQDYSLNKSKVECQNCDDIFRHARHKSWIYYSFFPHQICGAYLAIGLSANLLQ